VITRKRILNTDRESSVSKVSNSVIFEKRSVKSPIELHNKTISKLSGKYSQLKGRNQKEADQKVHNKSISHGRGRSRLKKMTRINSQLKAIYNQDLPTQEGNSLRDRSVDRYYSLCI